MIELFVQNGLLLVFVNVLLERIGLPLPATPILLLGGALAADGRLPGGTLFAAAFVACMFGDAVWYAAGWHYGRRVINLLCRVSLSPDSCVRQTETRFERWGPLTLVMAKFVPGLSTIARPLAGTLHMSFRSFAWFDGLGSALWIAAAMTVGMLCHAQIGLALLWVREFGLSALAAFCGLVAGYIGFKWWERRRFFAQVDVERVSVEELRRLMNSPEPPVIVDLRSALACRQDPRSIPGAISMRLEEIPLRLAALPVGREIVLYCACPHEATAAFGAKKLMALGYTRVRALRGGLDAWEAAPDQGPRGKLALRGGSGI